MIPPHLNMETLIIVVLTLTSALCRLLVKAKCIRKHVLVMLLVFSEKFWLKQYISHKFYHGVIF